MNKLLEFQQSQNATSHGAVGDKEPAPYLGEVSPRLDRSSVIRVFAMAGAVREGGA